MDKNPGPWYVATLQNSNGETKRIVHTFAEHFAFVYAVLRPEEKWVMTEVTGPFGSEQEAQETNPPNRWTFDNQEPLQIPDYTVLTLANIKKLKSKEG